MLTEAATEKKMQIIKESLCDFVTGHDPHADLSAVDDVIVSYVLAAIDAVDSAPEEFCLHVKDLVEILSAYVPEFAKIHRDAVYIWIMETIASLSEEKQKPYMDEAAEEERKQDILSFYFSNDGRNSSYASSRSNSTSEDEEKYQGCGSRKFQDSEFDEERFHDEYMESKEKAESLVVTAEMYKCQALVKFLADIFPDTSVIEVKHCVSIALGDVEGALATLLHRREHGLALSGGALPAATRPAPADNAVVKNRIIERYSYVDRESESREHKPLAPKHAPKKMVRYRDNKIVSLKGERYTEVSKGEEEGVKKSNKKHHP